MASSERINTEYRTRIISVVRQIKDGYEPTRGELASTLGIDASLADLFINSAHAWIYSENRDNLLEQLRTGRLDGVTPVASLDGGNKQL